MAQTDCCHCLCCRQGEDPGTDFRGSGLLGLQNLLYMANTHSLSFTALLHKTRGTRSAWEYPFACAGTNLTFVLAELLELKPKNRARWAQAVTVLKRMYDMESQTWKSSHKNYGVPVAAMVKALVNEPTPLSMNQKMLCHVMNLDLTK